MRAPRAFIRHGAGANLTHYTKIVGIVLAAGGTTSEQYARLLAGWGAIQAPVRTEESTAAVIDAIATGERSAVIAALNAHGFGLDIGRELSDLSFAVLERLHSEYMTASAEANRATIAGRFDAAAARLAKAVSVCSAAGIDVDGSAEAVVTADAKVRNAFGDAKAASEEMDGLLRAIAACALLAGRPVDDPGMSKDSPTWAPLVVDAEDKTAWFDRDRRCGRWGGLLAAGCVIGVRDFADYDKADVPQPAPVRHPQPGIPAGVKITTSGQAGHQLQPGQVERMG